jgi:hypothetical protein
MVGPIWVSWRLQISVAEAGPNSASVTNACGGQRFSGTLTNARQNFYKSWGQWLATYQPTNPTTFLILVEDYLQRILIHPLCYP